MENSSIFRRFWKLNQRKSTSNRCHNFHVDSPFKMDVISTNFPRGISTSNRWWIEEDMSIGNVGATLKLRHKMQRHHNVSTTASNSKRCTNITATLDSKFTSQHIMDVVMARSIHLCNRNSMSQRLYYDVAQALRQLCKERKTSPGNICSEKVLWRYDICPVFRVNMMQSNSVHYFSPIF